MNSNGIRSDVFLRVSRDVEKRTVTWSVTIAEEALSRVGGAGWSDFRDGDGDLLGVSDVMDRIAALVRVVEFRED